MDKHLNLRQMRASDHMFVPPWVCWDTYRVIKMDVKLLYAKGKLFYPGMSLCQNKQTKDIG